MQALDCWGGAWPSLPDRTGGAPEDSPRAASKPSQQPKGVWPGPDGSRAALGAPGPAGLLPSNKVEFWGGKPRGWVCISLTNSIQTPSGARDAPPPGTPRRGSGGAVHKGRGYGGEDSRPPQFRGVPQQGCSQAASLPERRARGVDRAPRVSGYLPAAPAGAPPAAALRWGRGRGGEGPAARLNPGGGAHRPSSEPGTKQPRAGRAVQAGGTRRPGQARERNRNSSEGTGAWVREGWGGGRAWGRDAPVERPELWARAGPFFQPGR